MNSNDCNYPNPHPASLWTFPPACDAVGASVLEVDQSSLASNVYRIQNALIEHVNEADRETFAGLRSMKIVEYSVGAAAVRRGSLFHRCIPQMYHTGTHPKDVYQKGKKGYVLLTCEPEFDNMDPNEIAKKF